MPLSLGLAVLLNSSLIGPAETTEPDWNSKTHALQESPAREHVFKRSRARLMNRLQTRESWPDPQDRDVTVLPIASLAF